MRTSVLFLRKNLGSFEIFGVSPRTKGSQEASADIFRTGGRGEICRDFVRASFMDGSLSFVLILTLENYLEWEAARN